jgi:hypothetical protein
MSKLILSVQAFLQSKGYNPGPLDGSEGPQTATAWNAFLDTIEGAAPAATAAVVPPPRPFSGPIVEPPAPAGASVKVGSIVVYEVGSLRAALSHMHVDADGSPHAYAPAPLIGLDYLANAGKPGNWWGIATDKSGKPYVQGASDPAPGYYVSTTSLQDASKAASDPARYVDSEKVPFVVIPPKPKFDVVIGDFGYAFNTLNGKSSGFVVADIGPANQLGEASVAIAERLGINSDAKKGGEDKAVVVYVFFACSKTSWPTDVDAAADGLLSASGGTARLRADFPGFDWSKVA